MSALTVYKVELRDLESVLRKKLGEQLSVVSYSTDSLLPVGENYGSTILKVRAVVKRKDDAEEEELHLVAKMMPATDFQRDMFDSPFTFKKESFFYEQLIPAYQQLEREFGVEPDKVFNNVPEIYGTRFSAAADGEVDEDAVILMQNLKVLGYYMVDRRIGMDEDHGRNAIIALARFHALGMAMKRHKPEFFKTIKAHSKCLKFEINEDDEEELEFFLKIMREDPEISPYYDDIKESMSLDQHELWEAEPSEPWSTIAHMDLWSNNIMYRKDPSTGRVADVKFVDFQNFLFMSPLRELAFFLMLNFELGLLEQKFDELLDLYYENFVSVLGAMDCDTAPFSRDKFDERLKIDAFLEFSHCPFMTKVMTAELTEDRKIDEIEHVLRKTSLSPMFMNRLRMYVKKYAEKGWFSKNSK